jgi:prepilin-type N-terminal cleavage/methylation domain-containing protein/prepilin-type processing-associated H-X9-DG protein
MGMGTPQIAARLRRFGFTLVELLVVIGIIALLISILMPSLARARASAISIDCQARMRTIGQSMQMYAAQFKGSLPGATNWFNVSGTWKSKPAATFLSEQLGSPEWTVNPVFNDKDTLEPDGGAAIGSNPYTGSLNADMVVSHYTPSIRLFPFIPAPGATTATPNERHNATNDASLASAYRNMGDIRNAAECAAWWDASQVTNWPGSAGKRAYPAYPYSDGTSDWGWHTYGNNFVSIDNRAGPDYKGNNNVTSLNTDSTLGTPQSQGGIRFRHMKNTSANILYADGHVSSHAFNPATGRTSMLIKELGTSFKPASKLK